MDTASWLASFGALQQDDAQGVESNDRPQKDESNDSAPDEDETGVGEETSLKQLISAGFGQSQAEDALAAASGDVELALCLLHKQKTAGPEEGPAAKRQRVVSNIPPDVFELEGGVLCKRGSGSGSKPKLWPLVLWLPEIAQEGPVVGKVKADGSVLFNGLDEWLREIYQATIPRLGCLGDLSSAKVDEVLSNEGVYVWDGFASDHEVQAAHDELEALFTKGVLTREANSAWLPECIEGGHAAGRKSLQKSKRDDAAGFWDLENGDLAPPPPPACRALFRRFEAAAALLRKDLGWPLLRCRLGMGAVYDGRGGFYAAHRDNEFTKHDFLAHGAGECNGGRHMNFRELTCVAYLNPKPAFEDPKDGGCLRCYEGARRGDLDGSTARNIRDVAPTAGKAVLFRAQELLHEVQPTQRRRYAITLWMVCNHTSA